MVAVLVQLKLRLLRNNLRRSPWRLVGMILAGLYGLGVVAMVIVGLVALRFAPAPYPGLVTTLAFSVLAFGWLVMSLLVFGVDETIDPARFALLPVRARDLLPGLTLAALLGVPGVATVLVALALFATWSTSWVVVSLILVVPVGVLTCVLLSRGVTAAFARALSSRRSRDVAIVIFVILMMSLGLAGTLIGRIASAPDPARILSSVAEVFSWTPFGWIWAVPGELAAGRFLGAIVRTVLALLLVLALAVVWHRALERNLTSPIEQTAASKAVRSDSGWERLYPATAAGAIAVRAIKYWRRDPRYLTSLASLILIPVILAGTFWLSGGQQTVAVAYAPIAVALFAGTSMASDLAYDGTAIAAHVLSGVSGRQDRIGRCLSLLTMVVPIQVVALVVCFLLSQQWAELPRVLALIIALLLCGLGAAMWIGTILPGKAPPPGASPFGSSNNGGLPALLSFGATMGSALLLSLPTVVLVIASFWVPWLGYLAVVVAAASGALALWWGIRLGGRRLDRHWPEVLAMVQPA